MDAVQGPDEASAPPVSHTDGRLSLDALMQVCRAVVGDDGDARELVYLAVGSSSRADASL